MAGIADVIIADRLTDGNQKLLIGAIDLQAGWSLSEAGLLSFRYPVRDLIAAGVQPGTLLGKWLHYTHPTAGAWGGHVTSVLPEDGMVSVGAESWVSLLRGIVTDGVTSNGVAGVLKRLIDAAKAQTGVSVGNATIATALVNRVDPQSVVGDVGSDVYEQVLPAVLDALNGDPNVNTALERPFGFNVDPLTRIFTFTQPIGVDRRATVKLAGGVTLVGAAWSDDLTDVINIVTVEGQYLIKGKPRSCKKWSKKKKHKPKKCLQYDPGTPDGNGTFTAVATNSPSVATYGRRSLRVTSDIVFSSQQQITTYAKQLVNAYSVNEQLVTVKVADDALSVGATQASTFASFKEGDVISVELPNEGVSGKMVVRHRALDVATGVMLVSGEALVS